MTSRALRLVAALAALAACGPSRPPVPVIDLAAPRDTIPLPFGEITDGVWLGGDRWAVVSPSTNSVSLVDAAAKSVTPKSVTPLGGAKTKELLHPFATFLSRDTLYVADWGLRRLTLWTDDGKLARAIPALDATRGALARARDAGGQFYAEISPRAGADGGGNRDSAAVVRVSPDGSKVDTLARLSPLDLAQVATDAGPRFERRVLSGTDRWGATSDGSLWIARVYQSRVEWRAADGTWKRGQPLPDRLLEVTPNDRELFYRQFPKELRHNAEQLPFTPIKPPFESAVAGPGPLVWLERSHVALDTVRAYQVVDRSGVLLREIRLPTEGRIVAVSERHALVAETKSGVTRLLRFALP